MAIYERGVARTAPFEANSLAVPQCALGGTVQRRIRPPKASAPAQTSPDGVRRPFYLRLRCPVFGVPHFMYAAFIATLIPSWIPAHMSGSILPVVGFIGAAVLSIACRLYAWLAQPLLGMMFLLWPILLHDRVVLALRNGGRVGESFRGTGMSGWLVRDAPSASRSDDPANLDDLTAHRRQKWLTVASDG